MRDVAQKAHEVSKGRQSERVIWAAWTHSYRTESPTLCEWHTSCFMNSAALTRCIPTRHVLRSKLCTPPPDVFDLPAVVWRVACGLCASGLRLLGTHHVLCTQVVCTSRAAACRHPKIARSKNRKSSIMTSCMHQSCMQVSRVATAQSVWGLPQPVLHSES